MLTSLREKLERLSLDKLFKTDNLSEQINIKNIIHIKFILEKINTIITQVKCDQLLFYSSINIVNPRTSKNT